MADPGILPPDNEKPSVGDIFEIVWLPALLAIITGAATWFIWYYTHTVCTTEVAALTGCNPGVIAGYVNVDVFGRMLTYGVLVGGVGGLWRYDVIKKERAARIAAQTQLAELQKQWQEERQGLMEALAEARRQAEERAAEERQRAAEARRQAEERAAEERQRTAEDRRLAEERAAEERRLAEERAAEERRQAAEDRRAFLSALTELTAELAHIRQQRNGGSHGAN